MIDIAYLAPKKKRPRPSDLGVSGGVSSSSWTRTSNPSICPDPTTRIDPVRLSATKQVNRSGFLSTLIDHIRPWLVRFFRSFPTHNRRMIMFGGVACVAGITALAALLGLAYAVIGYYVANTIAAFHRAPWVFDVSLLAWVGVGLVALTVWTSRFARNDVRKTTRTGGGR